MRTYLFFSTLYILSFFGVFTSIQAQSYHNIGVSNFQFEPAHLEIQVGDTVEWENTQGLHSVEGTTIVFPDNPESFGNASAPAPWTYTFVFNIPGEYSYRCGVHPETMVGSIVVNADTVLAIDEAETSGIFQLYPNPVKNELRWKWSNNSAPTKANIKIYDVTGKLTSSFPLDFASYKDVSDWTEGLYIYTISSQTEPIQTGKLFIIK